MYVSSELKISKSEQTRTILHKKIIPLKNTFFTRTEFSAKDKKHRMLSYALPPMLIWWNSSSLPHTCHYYIIWSGLSRSLECVEQMTGLLAPLTPLPFISLSATAGWKFLKREHSQKYMCAACVSHQELNQQKRVWSVSRGCCGVKSLWFDANFRELRIGLKK